MNRSKKTNSNHQNFTIHGIKFFKANLDRLRYNSMLTENAITTAEVSVYMILHLYTDEMGQIRSLTKDKNVSDRKLLCISNIAKEHDLTYETVKKAFDSLIKRNYIAEVFTKEGMHYEIVNYAQLNQDHDNELNYFRIPHALFEEKLFGELIKHRYHKGPILILELCQYFTRQIGMNRRNAENIDQITGERTMSYLKKALHTTAQRVRQFLSIIHNVFIFKSIDQQIKKPSPTRYSRVREFVQICINKYTFSLNPNCFKENENVDQKRSLAAAKKEMTARIKNARIPLKWRDHLDINKSINRISKIAANLNIIGKANNMIKYTVMTVADKLENIHKEGGFIDIRSVGAFVNKLFTSAWIEYRDNYLSEGEKVEVISNYMQTFGEAPRFLN